jgi:hypothetical protein
VQFRYTPVVGLRIDYPCSSLRILSFGAAERSARVKRFPQFVEYFRVYFLSHVGVGSSPNQEVWQNNFDSFAQERLKISKRGNMHTSSASSVCYLNVEFLLKPATEKLKTTSHHPGSHYFLWKQLNERCRCGTQHGYSWSFSFPNVISSVNNQAFE